MTIFITKVLRQCCLNHNKMFSLYLKKGLKLTRNVSKILYKRITKGIVFIKN